MYKIECVPAELHFIFNGPEGGGFPLVLRSTCSANSMNVRHKTGREVVIDHQVDSFKVDTSGHELSADQYPDLLGTECLNTLLPLQHQRHIMNAFIIHLKEYLYIYTCLNVLVSKVVTLSANSPKVVNSL